MKTRNLSGRVTKNKFCQAGGNINEVCFVTSTKTYLGNIEGFKDLIAVGDGDGTIVGAVNEEVGCAVGICFGVVDGDMDGDADVVFAGPNGGT